MTRSSTDIAFTAAVKALQEKKRSRASYARLEAKGGWPTTITPELAHFLASVRSFYLATASRDGQPYVQHRGGPPGFLKMLDATTLAFADYAGNRQYITAGNLAENPQAFIFLMDYTKRRRIKIWGRAWIVEDDRELIARLSSTHYPARVEHAIVFAVHAWDENCPQHIPQMHFAEGVSSLKD